MLSDETYMKYAVRFIGTLIGVMASLIMVAPAHSKAMVNRVLVSITMGFIFAPAVPLFGLFGVVPFAFLSGEGADMIMARAAACGFCVWFVLELIARMLSSTEWLERLLKGILEARAGNKADEQ